MALQGFLFLELEGALAAQRLESNGGRGPEAAPFCLPNEPPAPRPPPCSQTPSSEAPIPSTAKYPALLCAGPWFLEQEVETRLLPKGARGQGQRDAGNHGSLCHSGPGLLKSPRLCPGGLRFPERSGRALRGSKVPWMFPQSPPSLSPRARHTSPFSAQEWPDGCRSGRICQQR